MTGAENGLKGGWISREAESLRGISWSDIWANIRAVTLVPVSARRNCVGGNPRTGGSGCDRARNVTVRDRLYFASGCSLRDRQVGGTCMDVRNCDFFKGVHSASIG